MCNWLPLLLINTVVTHVYQLELHFSNAFLFNLNYLQQFETRYNNINEEGPGGLIKIDFKPISIIIIIEKGR